MGANEAKSIPFEWMVVDSTRPAACGNHRELPLRWDVDARQRLIDLLTRAYSGELAAALAYRGHAASVGSDPAAAEIRRIEMEELDHRRRVGLMLGALGAQPDPARERRAKVVGTLLGAGCRVAGRFLPMYGAGRLESGNIREYEAAACEAWTMGRTSFADELLAMAEVEWEHERFFRTEAACDALWAHVPRWPIPPPRELIRSCFDAFVRRPAEIRFAPASPPVH